MKSHILVVDDDFYIRILLQEILIQQGYTVQIAHDGAEALRFIQKHPDKYNLVLTDIDMPVMDGLALGKILNDQYPDLPVIALTGNRITPDYHHVLELIFTDILQKPFEITELLTTVRKYFK